jgi:hypothetical protein
MLITSGLFLGTSSYIFSTSFGVSFLIYFIVYRLKSKLPLSDLFVFGSSTLIAFLFSFFSPGSTFRRNNLKNLPIENLSMGDSFHRWAGTMASFVFSGSFLATLAFGIIFYNLFLSKVRSSNFGTKLDSWILQLIIFVLICSFFTSVANYNIGWSPWHALYWAMAVWLLAFVMGLRLGTLPILQINKNILFFTILIFASVVSIQAALKVSASINDRWLAWEKGPAPIAGLEDREVEWVRNCISTRIYES